MSRFENILVGYDGFERSERLPVLALVLAREHRARLHVVNVVPVLPRRVWRGRTVSATELHAALCETRKHRLEHLLTGPRTDGLITRAVIRVGSPHVELIREAISIRADLLVVSDEPRRGESRGFGTVTNKLLRECPCPVLAKRDHRKYKHRRILVAVDLGSDTADESVNRRIMDIAAAIARQAGGRLLVFHAWCLWGEHLLWARARSRADEEEIRRSLEETSGGQRRLLDRLIEQSDLRGIEVETLLAKGQPRDMLPAIVESEHIDLVVMGTVGRTRIKGFLIGNTAEKVLNELPCSVLAVKPDSFVSPLAALEHAGPAATSEGSGSHADRFNLGLLAHAEP